MVIIIKKTLLAFAEKHPLAAAPLNNWYSIAKTADWNKLADIKKHLIRLIMWATTGTYLILKETISGW